MNRTDGIYFEHKVNQKGDGRFYQLEIEVHILGSGWMEWMLD